MIRWMCLIALPLALLVVAAAPPSAAPLDAASPNASDATSISPRTEAAIDRGLKYLADKQLPDGTWKAPIGRSTAVDSLCVLAFLSRGQVPGQGPWGDKINKAIDAVLAAQQSSGMISVGNRNMYDHGASTVMLAEAYGMLDDGRKVKVEVALGKAVKLILDAQKRTRAQYAGGWHYQPTQQDADISCSGWQIVGLRGAANCGATVPKDALDEAAGFLHRVSCNGGGFCYQPGGGPNRARTGTGTLCLCLLGRYGEADAQAGGDWLLRHPLNNPDDEFYYYSVYYCSQAANQLGGKYWQGIYPTLRDTLLKRQQGDGSWPHANSQEAQGGTSYTTAMAVQALCVPYQYLPLYQK